MKFLRHFLESPPDKQIMTRESWTHYSWRIECLKSSLLHMPCTKFFVSILQEVSNLLYEFSLTGFFLHQSGSGRGVLIPHSCSFFTRIPNHALVFTAIPNPVFSFPKNTFPQKLINLRSDLDWPFRLIF